MNQIVSRFYHKDFISVEQIEKPQDLQSIFFLADKMKTRIEKRQSCDDLSGFCIAELFYQPSTRTFTSFLAAGLHLGARVVPVHGMQAYSSAVKGESLPDTIRTVEQTTACDLIVLRHPDDSSSEIAAKFARVPVINAGSGTKEHPTQALLDLYTIKNHFDKMDGLRVTFVGDMKYGRTVKSLSKLLAVCTGGVTMNFVSPQDLQMPADDINKLKDNGVSINQSDRLDGCLNKTDVLYVTRVQKEWFEKEGKMAAYEKLKDYYIINAKMLTNVSENLIVMHPLPRVGEIDQDVDASPRAKYFEQMRNGLYIRMALLRLILLGK